MSASKQIEIEEEDDKLKTRTPPPLFYPIGFVKQFYIGNTEE